MELNFAVQTVTLGCGDCSARSSGGISMYYAVLRLAQIPFSV
jgi:hypothetical protein